MRRSEFVLCCLASAFFGSAAYCVTHLIVERHPAPTEVHYKMAPRDEKELADLATRAKVAEQHAANLLALAYWQNERLRELGSEPAPQTWPRNLLRTADVQPGDLIPPQNVPVPQAEEKP